MTDLVEFSTTARRLEDGVYEIAVGGEFDLYTAPDVKEEVRGLPAEIRHLVIDLTAVTFIDSAALGVLATAARQLRDRGGRVVLAVDDANILKVLRITGFDRLFEIRTPLRTL